MGCVEKVTAFAAIDAAREQNYLGKEVLYIKW